MIEGCVAFAVLLLYTWHNDFNAYYACTFTFLWGMEDSGVVNFINCVLGFQFHSKAIAFSAFRIIQCIFIFGFISLQTLIKSQKAFFIYFLACAAFAIIAWLTFIFAFELKDDGEKRNSLVDETKRASILK